MSEDALPHLRQPDLECLAPTTEESLCDMTAQAVTAAVDEYLDFGRHESVTVEESTAYCIEGDHETLEDIPAPLYASCFRRSSDEDSEEDYEGRQSVAVQEATTFCVEEGLELPASQQLHQQVNIVSSEVDEQRQSMALEESTAFCVEEGLEFSPPTAKKASEILEDNDNRMRCCSVTVVQEPPTAFIHANDPTASTALVKAVLSSAEMEECAALGVATVNGFPAVFEEASSPSSNASSSTLTEIKMEETANYYPVHAAATAIATSCTTSWSRG